jgi:hypothetical protein
MTVIGRSGVLVGVPKPAPPVVLESRETKEKTAFQAVAVAVITPQAMAQLVSEITRNVTANVISNMTARLKDRCFHASCNVSRAAHHVNSHDFTEKPKAVE